MEGDTSQVAARRYTSLDAIPLEVLTMIIRHLSPSRGPFIIYIKGYGDMGSSRPSRAFSDRDPPVAYENFDTKVSAIRGTFMGLRLVCRQLYIKTKALIEEVPILLRVEPGTRFSTARRLVGDNSLSRISDLRISFHERSMGKIVNEKYYKYFFDMGAEDIRNLFPGLTKLTLIAPYDARYIDSVCPDLVSICNMFAANHPRVDQVRIISEYGRVSFEVSI